MSSSPNLKEILQEFYTDNNFGEDGNAYNKIAWFDFKVIKIPLPNPKGRQEVLYIHDLHHLLHNKSTKWSDEVFITGWEISTGLGTHYMAWVFSFTAFFIGVFTYPKQLFLGFSKGASTKGIISLNLSKKDLLSLSLEELKSKTQIDIHHNTKPSFSLVLRFSIFVLISLIIFLLPILLIVRIFVF
ncbi:hypothetical protein [Aquimarina algiphila]|uniref:hypothetical protein n=1 Tax=Aquimarina algiphila TaxID=2047982 RepID=UPI0024930A20|nr:hypothetical protein [Aquimarina algiphila]